jgi:hypothetical protein
MLVMLFSDQASTIKEWTELHHFSQYIVTILAIDSVVNGQDFFWKYISILLDKDRTKVHTHTEKYEKDTEVAAPAKLHKGP